MSRVEDDREAARQAARAAEQRRLDESKKKDRVQADGVFSKLVGQAKDEKRAGQQQQTAKESNARSAIAALLEQAESASAQAGEAAEHAGLESQRQQQGFQGRLGQKGLDERLRQGSRSEGQHAEKLKLLADQGDSQATAGRSNDAQHAGASTEARKADAKAGRERIDERREASEAAKSGKAVSGAEGKGDASELKSDADKGGQQGGGGGKDEGKGGAGAPGFRFNPALMAPVPVAQKKDVSGSERLRKIANELAQKIVERVRVGTNALGRAEFQIDMRSDVLSGLTVKVSSHQGKIKAVFSGSDRDVLKLIEQQGEALQAALSARGLSLEEFKVEARA